MDVIDLSVFTYGGDTGITDIEICWQEDGTSITNFDNLSTADGSEITSITIRPYYETDSYNGVLDLSRALEGMTNVSRYNFFGNMQIDVLHIVQPESVGDVRADFRDGATPINVAAFDESSVKQVFISKVDMSGKTEGFQSVTTLENFGCSECGLESISDFLNMSSVVQLSFIDNNLDNSESITPFAAFSGFVDEDGNPILKNLFLSGNDGTTDAAIAVLQDAFGEDENGNPNVFIDYTPRGG